MDEACWADLDSVAKVLRTAAGPEIVENDFSKGIRKGFLLAADLAESRVRSARELDAALRGLGS